MSGPHYPQQAYQAPQQGPRPPYAGDRDSQSSLQGLNAAAVPMGAVTPGYRTPSRSPPSYGAGHYSDDPYQGYSLPPDPHLGIVNPNEIFDDGDDGLGGYGQRRGPRTSMLSLGGTSNRSGNSGGAAAGAGAAAAAGGAGAGVIGGLGGMVGRNGRSQYDAVQGANTGYQGGGGGGAHDGAMTAAEKSAWLAKKSGNSKKWKLLIIFGIGALIVLGIGLGVYFGVTRRSNDTGAASGESASDDTAANGDLDLDSAEIQKLLNNPDLHKVFPGIDYTPINTQFPDCLTNPPSQNNVTRDVAVLSQLTNTIRLYGTDCNQTEMTLHALRQLKMNDTIKIWMGVWQDNNDTTNARQLSQMWDILETYGDTPFKGLIVANEILFREQMTITQLGDLLSDVRANLTAKGMSLPVATSDLGDKWDAALAAQSDYVMSNIHPFFAGTPAATAAEWTWVFWDGHNAALQPDLSKNVIAETGWPSQGGMDCGDGTATGCPGAAVAGVDELNTFMEGWVCQALANGTQYFWFESFDEPWKIAYNTGDENWEDHWGLMDVDRNLKAGVKIPDCGGATAP